MTTKKRGRLSVDEQKTIIDNYKKMPAEDIAALLNRTPDPIIKFIEKNCGPVAPTERPHREFPAPSPGPSEASEGQATPTRLAVRQALKNSDGWRTIQKEFTDDELRSFEEEYVKLMSQFKDDILPTEETQIIQVVKIQILASRNLIARRQVLEELGRTKKKLQEILSMPSPGEADIMRAGSLENRFDKLREEERKYADEFIKLQDKHRDLMKTLKATRDQRFKEIENRKESYLGLVKALQDERMRKKEGREMELARIAADREQERLSYTHQYADGEYDQPLILPEDD